MKLTFSAYGNPIPQPRPRVAVFGGRPRVYDSGKANAWKKQVELAAIDAINRVGFLRLQTPVLVRMDFFLTRPKAHFKSGNTTGGLRDKAPLYHTQKPDCDNLAKAVLDAMTTAGVWSDDAQVIELRVTKAWAVRGDCGVDVSVE